MGFAFIIFLRILFAACMVFVIGYIFGGFSKRPALARITKVAAILAIVLFIGTNLLLNRLVFAQHRGGPGGWRCNDREWRYDRDHRMEEHRQAPATLPPAAADSTTQ
ncbi:hypothetical protein ACFOTA_04990 [Chitinophaga sp. GCM10012297]|uniref:Uncharacterized protein n=1 Tax=Chitinophaga chungangae TaxID=2821488 RepID=A0ABS3YA40_9BACT|nr:hypothetical protein [Chitinophaga chungangae]MBO9151550.1 hypothetical protein [Chitinophaga chungangae]